MGSIDSDREVVLSVEDMEAVNNSIPQAVHKIVDGMALLEYPEDKDFLGRKCLLWESKKRLYKTLGFTWYSPLDMHLKVKI